MFAGLFKSGGYRPSGKCDWFKLLTVALPLSLPAACVTSCILYLAFHFEFYLLILMPLLAGAVLGWEVSCLFRFAHCRNPYVAAGFGVLLGSVMYLGYYHCRYVAVAGPRALYRIDVLPKYIDFCLHHDITRSTHDNGNQPKQPNLYENWFFFLADWAVAAACCAGIAIAGARKAYCETCSRWMLSKKATVDAGWADKVVRSVRTKQIASLPTLPSVKSKRAGQVAQFQLEYCPGNPEQDEICPIFLTASEITPKNKRSVVVARQIPLAVEELAELSQKLTFQ